MAAVLGGLLTLGVSVNNNLVDYLPESAPSTKAIAIMADAFGGATENARVMAPDITLSQALDLKARLAAIKGVRSVTWLDDVIDMSIPIEMADQAVVDNYYKDNNALYSISIADGQEVAATDAILEILRPEYALAGQAVERAQLQRVASLETRNAMLILLPLILIVLLISTESWLEPLLYLGAIGISVLINMGTNIIFKNVSFITNTVSPILQLAVSLDYAVFLLHRFKANRARMEPDAAMREAMGFSFSAIAASAATTFFGFLALMFMKFQLGSDLGLNLVKGIALSFISVIVFLPSLTLCALPLIDKTRHRPLLPQFDRSRIKNGKKVYGIGSALYKVRWGALIVVVLLMIPAYLAQNKNTFEYGMASVTQQDDVTSDTARISAVYGMTSPLVALIPTGQPGKEAELSAKLGKLSHVTSVISYANQIGSAIPPEMVPQSALSIFQSKGWSRIIMYVDATEESPEAYQLVADARAIVSELYPEESYVTGGHANLYDIRDVITGDNKVVNYVAIGAILLVLLLTFKSVSLPLLLTLTIETATWINLSVPYFTNSSLCYIGYLVVSTVQLGATVDYAILFTDHYIKNRKKRDKREAISKSISRTFGSILVSGLILSGAGVALAITSSNAIVSQMGLLLARGTVLSFLLVIFFLPAACSLFDLVIRRTTIGAKFLVKDGSDVETMDVEGSDE